MFYFKNSFLKVLMISVVYFSITNAVDKENDMNIIQRMHKCKDEMLNNFGQVSNTLHCIKVAVTMMKLHGEPKFTYYKDVSKFYEHFHLLVDTDKILLPEEFCKTITSNFNLEKAPPFDQMQATLMCARNNLKCIMELRIFLNDKHFPKSLLNVQEIRSKAAQPHIVESFPRGTSSVQQNNTDAGSSTSGTLSESYLKSIIMMNALYYHTTREPPPEHILTEETFLYFHGFETYGYFYLDHIAEVVKLVEGRVILPMEFCSFINNN